MCIGMLIIKIDPVMVRQQLNAFFSECTASIKFGENTGINNKSKNFKQKKYLYP